MLASMSRDTGLGDLRERGKGVEGPLIPRSGWSFSPAESEEFQPSVESVFSVNVANTEAAVLWQRDYFQITVEIATDHG